jgi:hypothetical protein
MKYLKTAFIVATFNFFIVASIIYFFRGTTATKTSSTSVSMAVAISVLPSKVTPTPDPRCIIVVDGQKYNVTDFMTIHSGGNIFQCGTDMSPTFHQRHRDSYLQIMAQYKI